MRLSRSSCAPWHPERWLWALFKETTMLRDRVRVLNKYVTNRVLRGLAHLHRGPFALVRHVGRRSGKPYETVIMVWPTGAGFVIALTYGPNVDWYRNLVAAGGGTVYWHGRAYKIGRASCRERVSVEVSA